MLGWEITGPKGRKGGQMQDSISPAGLTEFHMPLGGFRIPLNSITPYDMYIVAQVASCTVGHVCWYLCWLMSAYMYLLLCYMQQTGDTSTRKFTIHGLSHICLFLRLRNMVPVTVTPVTTGFLPAYFFPGKVSLPTALSQLIPV